MRYAHWLPFTVLVLVAATIAPTAARAEWDYKTVHSALTQTEIAPVLEQATKDGWELVSVVQDAKSGELLYFFKRPRVAVAIPAPTLPASPAVPVGPPVPAGQPTGSSGQPTVPAGQTSTPADLIAARDIAAGYFEALVTGDTLKANQLSAAPFSFDRKDVLKTQEDVENRHKGIVANKKIVPEYFISPTLNAPALDRKVFPDYDAFRVDITATHAHVDIYVSKGATPKVIGFSD